MYRYQIMFQASGSALDLAQLNAQMMTTKCAYTPCQSACLVLEPETGCLVCKSSCSSGSVGSMPMNMPSGRLVCTQSCIRHSHMCKTMLVISCKSEPKFLVSVCPQVAGVFAFIGECSCLQTNTCYSQLCRGCNLVC